MIQIFLGGIRPLPPDNQPTGIFKHEVLMPVWVGREGLAGDAQADRRVHGGPDKALHQYAIANYARLATAFPDAANLLIPGSTGENLSAPRWDETNIAIGDVFRFGDSTIQVSQPRSPCWKIDNRFGVEGLAQYIAEQRITGWYFRVLEEGAAETSADFERIERNVDPVSIADLLSLWGEHRPDLDRLIEISRTPGLTASWVNKFEDRAARLRQMAVDKPKLFHPRPDPNMQG
jgi:MOSC domain-containing protein YiiM